MKDIKRDPDLEWLELLPPVGLVIAPTVLKRLGLVPLRQTAFDSAQIEAFAQENDTIPALSAPWSFFETILGWEAKHVAGAPGGPALPDSLTIALPEQSTVLSPTWAVGELGAAGGDWQMLVRIEAPGVKPDDKAALDGWEATPHQRFERLLRETGVHIGLLVTEWVDGQQRTHPEVRLVYAPRGETSGHQSFPIRPLAFASGREMLAGLKLLLDRTRLFTDGADRRLSALLSESRKAQEEVSSALAEQVLGALHELLRGFDAAVPETVRAFAANSPERLYEGLLTVLMRLVFILYAEDRDLLPSAQDGRARQLYEQGYSVRGFYAKLQDDAALNPDTMDERRGVWGGLLALFRLIHAGHPSGFIQARGGKLFDPDEFPFLEGRDTPWAKPKVLNISDGCMLRIFEKLMTVHVKGSGPQRLSYRTLDVEQIGSVYETVMGFTVEAAPARMLAVKAGKNNKTPVFVSLDGLLEKKGKERFKIFKEETGRALTDKQAKEVEKAQGIDDLAVALDSLVDERGSPNKQLSPKGTPILQPTDERRRTGSHYTPRSLTAPIVKHALEPAFARLGGQATPEQILALKVCDPAMGSGAFLVEACRALGERLVKAWEYHKSKPKIPADEDEDLHAKRLVAQRCLYGVDRNPRAVDLAKLSIWLATLARDHEFTFLDHALKSGDSLVGLSNSQIAAANWDETKPGLSLFRSLVKDQVRRVKEGRAEIHNAPDDTRRAILEGKHRLLDEKIAPVRMFGDAILSTFFTQDKTKAREKERLGVELHISSSPPNWDAIGVAAQKLHGEAIGIRPFHWELEFPEVFDRDNGGFDAIVGNPPFAGKNTVIAGNPKNYLPWLQELHEHAHGNADLVAHFFRRAFGLLRKDGMAGLISTNTIGQGDTRASGLTHILQNGGSILRATRRLKWPGEAAVVVSVVHVMKGAAATPVLNGKPARRISAYLVEGDLDVSPQALAANSGKAFRGQDVYGMGFTFDDKDKKGIASPIHVMTDLIDKNSQNSSVIRSYIGGEELNDHPEQKHRRFVIDFGSMPLMRDRSISLWSMSTQEQKQEWLSTGIVPEDYPKEVASDWPELVEILRIKVKPEREKSRNKDIQVYPWWKHWRLGGAISAGTKDLERIFARSRVSAHHAVAANSPDLLFADSTILFAFPNFSPFSTLQSRAHELWARFFSSSMKDDLRYAPSDCFRTFPFPANYEADPSLEAAGGAYHAFRAHLMIARNEGLTKTYNRFHDQDETSNSIVELRSLHHAMDVAVLRAYGWDDLAATAAPEFIEQDADEGKKAKTRLDWPSDFKDEVLSRLLALNAERAAAEKAAGLIPAVEEEVDEENEEAESA